MRADFAQRRSAGCEPVSDRNHDLSSMHRLGPRQPVANEVRGDCTYETPDCSGLAAGHRTESLSDEVGQPRIAIDEPDRFAAVTRVTSRPDNRPNKRLIVGEANEQVGHFLRHPARGATERLKVPYNLHRELGAAGAMTHPTDPVSLEGVVEAVYCSTVIAYGHANGRSSAHWFSCHAHECVHTL